MVASILTGLFISGSLVFWWKERQQLKNEQADKQLQEERKLDLEKEKKRLVKEHNEAVRRQKEMANQILEARRRKEASRFSEEEQERILRTARLANYLPEN